jgi:quinohemoprotein ethanol dehydrogenase
VTNPIEVEGAVYVSHADSQVTRRADRQHARSWIRTHPSSWVSGCGRGGGAAALPGGTARSPGGTQDGRLLSALDVESGQPLWSVQTRQPGDFRFISGVPRVLAGKVIIGHGGLIRVIRAAM